jgi:hypothetical protein
MQPMKKMFRTAVLGTVLMAAACQTTGQAPLHRLPAAVAPPEDLSGLELHRPPAAVAPPEDPPSLEKVLRTLPSVRWERSPRTAAKTDYWLVPGEEPFYLFRHGVQFIGDESALRYSTTPRGFDLLTIEKKEAVKHHPVCPSFAPLLQCIDNHTLLIVTHISCGKVSCGYDFIIIDYFRKIPFAANPPAIKEVIDYVLEEHPRESYFPFRFSRSFSERHRSRGNITPDNPLWLDFIRRNFSIIQDKIDVAVARNEIRIVGN